MEKEVKKFTVLCGNKRSGTSMLMLALKESGVPISGFKYPVKIKNEDAKELDAGCMFPLNSHLKLCSPSGFWEYGSVIEQGLQSQHKEYDGDVIKVTLPKLTMSNRDLIERVIMIYRNPRKVLASRMKVGELIVKNDLDIEMSSIILLNNTVWAFQWMREQGLRFRLMIYEELLEEPMHYLKALCIWIGRGNAGYAKDVIKPSLDRVDPINIDSPLMEELDEMCALIKNRNFAKIYDIDVKQYSRRYNELYNRMSEQDNKVSQT